MCTYKKQKYENCVVRKNLKFTVNRTLFVSKEMVKTDYEGVPIKQPMYKFEEKLVFSGSHKCNKKMAICIGYNPALSCEHLDETNKRLCVQLKAMGYDGYHLYNLYPEVTSHKKELNPNDKNNITSTRNLKKMINRKKYRCGLIILFFGRTAELNNEQVDFLKELTANKNLTIMLTTKNGEFTHLSKIWSLDLIEFKQEYIRKSRTHFIIRVNQ